MWRRWRVSPAVVAAAAAAGVLLVGLLLWAASRGPRFVAAGGGKLRGVVVESQGDIRDVGWGMGSTSDGGAAAVGYDNVTAPAPGYAFYQVRTEQPVWFFAWDRAGRPVVTFARPQGLAFPTSQYPNESTSLRFNAHGFIALVPNDAGRVEVHLIDFPSSPERLQRAREFLGTLPGRRLSYAQAFQAAEMAYDARPVTDPAVRSMLMSIARGDAALEDVTTASATGRIGRMRSTYAPGRRRIASGGGGGGDAVRARAALALCPATPPATPAERAELLALLGEPATATYAFGTLQGWAATPPPEAVDALRRAALAARDETALQILDLIEEVSPEVYGETALDLLVHPNGTVRRYALVRVQSERGSGRLHGPRTEQHLVRLYRGLNTAAERENFYEESLKHLRSGGPPEVPGEGSGETAAPSEEPGE